MLSSRYDVGGKGLAILMVAVEMWSTPLAATADPAPVEFADQTALSIGIEPTTVVLVNNTARGWELSIAAVIIGSGTSEPIPVSLNDVPASIAPSGAAVFTVGPAPSDVTEGSGFVVATATAGDDTSVTRRPLVLSPVTPKPLVKKWFGSSQGSVPTLPLSGDTCGAVTSGTVYVVSGSDIAPIDYDCAVSDGVPALTFATDQVSEIGQYGGTLTLAGPDVEVSFLKTTQWIVPLLVILAGFVLAAAQYAWVNSYRPVRRAEVRLVGIGKAADTNQQEFERRAGAEPYRLYHFLRGAYREIAQLERRLDALRPSPFRRWFLGFIPWGQAEQDPDYKEILEEMAVLEATVNDWPGLADALSEMAARLSQAEGDGSHRLAEGLAARARAILTLARGNNTYVELDRKAATSLLVEVPRTTQALAILTRVVELDKAIAQLRPHKHQMDASDQDVFEEAERLYRQVRAELATAADAAAVERAKVDELLQSSRAGILQLTKPTVVVEGQAVEEAPVEELVVGFVSLFRGITQVGARIAGNVRAVDGVWLLLALAVAAWTGLAALYVGKPWGRWADYVALFVWAFGTTAVLTPVLSGLDRLAAGPLPLKIPAADGDAK